MRSSQQHRPPPWGRTGTEEITSWNNCRLPSGTMEFADRLKRGSHQEEFSLRTWRFPALRQCCSPVRLLRGPRFSVTPPPWHAQHAHGHVAVRGGGDQSCRTLSQGVFERATGDIHDGDGAEQPGAYERMLGRIGPVGRWAGGPVDDSVRDGVYTCFLSRASGLLDKEGRFRPRPYPCDRPQKPRTNPRHQLIPQGVRKPPAWVPRRPQGMGMPGRCCHAAFDVESWERLSLSDEIPLFRRNWLSRVLVLTQLRHRFRGTGRASGPGNGSTGRHRRSGWRDH